MRLSLSTERSDTGTIRQEKIGCQKLGVRSTLLQGLKKDNGATEGKARVPGLHYSQRGKARVSGLHGLLHK